jgi:hypothetical protein
MDAWTAAASLTDPAVHSGPLDAAYIYADRNRSAEQRLQRAMTNQIELATRDALDIDIRALPHADPRREAWLSTDSFSSQ